MKSNKKANTAHPKYTKKAKPQTTKMQHDPAKVDMLQESGGPKGPEPTRYGDWENNGRCTDF